MSQATVSQTNTNRNPVSSQSQSSPINVNDLPLNHQEFLRRVQTFNSLQLHINQHNINPLLCARFGWQCISQNTLECTGCNTKITINYTNTNTFLNCLKSSHKLECIFTNNNQLNINKSYEKLPIYSIMKQELISNISTYISNYLQLNFIQIPQINSKIKNLIISQQKWTKNILNNEIIFSIIILSIYGWYLKRNKYLQCQYCNKCIFITNYKFNKFNKIFNEIYNEISELSIENEEESIIYKLSKLGLKINNNIRSHKCRVYETQSLQKQAQFNNNKNNCNKKRQILRGGFSTFNGGFGQFKGNNNNNNNNWPKESVLNIKKINKNNKINKKRTRIQMSLDFDENENDNKNSDGFNENNNNIQCPMPRKKMKILKMKNKSKKGRKNRKRKTMDEYNQSNDNNIIAVKKRRITSDLCNNNNNNNNNNVKKSRKRKFNDVFMNNNNNNNNANKCESNVKRIKLNKLYFDMIGLHNDLCPFKIKNMYELNECDNDQCIYGWEYCLKLIPNNIEFIQNIIKQLKKK